MRKLSFRILLLCTLAGLVFIGRPGASPAASSVQRPEQNRPVEPAAAQPPVIESWTALESRITLNIEPAVDRPIFAQQASQPVFRYPVVPDATISGYFDHQSAGGIVHHYNGRHNSPGAGFYFKCPSVYMNDWVGCEDVVSGEPSCANNREIWYDNHRGIDYEFAPNWHTGDTCIPSRFTGITMPIYAPARARVLMAGTDPSRWANGWHIRLQHDLNNNGNFSDDMFRSIYLHFTAGALAVSPGQIIEEGHYLGLGGSTGYSSSPHLHFEVQRSSDNFQSSFWSVDPYGWQGPGGDPWPYTNILLFRMSESVEFTDFLHLPFTVFNQPSCVNCGELVKNNGFESGAVAWDAQDPGSNPLDNIIVNTGYATLPIAPHGGNWLAWLGGNLDTSDSVNQLIVIPQEAKTGVLRYYLYMTTEESGAAADFYVARLKTTSGNVVQQMEYLDNTFADRNHWVLREVSLSLEGLQGQTLILQFKGMNDASSKTSFFIDDISLTASD